MIFTIGCYHFSPLSFASSCSLHLSQLVCGERSLGLTQAICNSAGAWIHQHSTTALSFRGPAGPSKASPAPLSSLSTIILTCINFTDICSQLHKCRGESHLEPFSLGSLTNYIQPHPFLFLIVYICKDDSAPVKALERQFRDSQGSSTAHE